MNVLLMFAKAPVPGQVKTRLAKHIGDELAAKLHESFLQDLCRDLSKNLPEDTTLALLHAGDPEHPSFRFASEHGWLLEPQPTGGLGDRLTAASRWAFEGLGAERVAFIGSDAPTLSARHVSNAWSCLRVTKGEKEEQEEQGEDVSIVPSGDGGYVLLASNAHRPELFAHGVWSSVRTLGATLRAVEDLRVRVFDFWYDVDLFVDLSLLRDHLLLHLARPEGHEYGSTIKTLRELEETGVLSPPES